MFLPHQCLIFDDTSLCEPNASYGLGSLIPRPLPMHILQVMGRCTGHGNEAEV